MSFSTFRPPISLSPAANFRSTASFCSGGNSRLSRSLWNSPVCLASCLRTWPSDFFSVAPDDDWLAFHQRADVLEAHRRLMDLHTEQLGHRIDLMARRHRADDRAGPAAILLQVIQGKRQDLVWGQPGAVFVHNAKAVGVTVQAEAQLRFAFADKLAHIPHAFSVWLGMMAAKKRVELVMEPGDFRAALFEQGVEVTASGAVHQLDG